MRGAVTLAAGCWGQGLRVAKCERELNALGYELYGLTEEEITIVEGQNHRTTERSEHTERPALSRAAGVSVSQ